MVNIRIRKNIIRSVIPIRTRLRDLRLTIQKNSPVDSGALKRSWSDPRTVQLLPSGEIQIDNPLPYARIQDLGGHIKKYDIVEAKGPGHVMRAEIGGKIRFFTKRKGFNIKAQRYVSESVAEWKQTPSGAGLDVTWISRQSTLAGLLTKVTKSLATLRGLEKARLKFQNTGEKVA